ncbi:MAG: squalene/phytoene synthase family protein [Acidobacteria bacterium]|nr:squalene/phytoene synthase family protein [Acidobacteriota bacterium]NIO58773.1 squalene/phytoene synthase family protein [Acidobacteriota bacterium]NIQ84539.1 squalene/phytoene synthase family protein [Acidobacteriota bacterium]NIT10493.1 squalene/phytoene synthase family protein [Acidobacteriota bacterium]
MAVSARERLEDLLEKTSRTFALSIPPLPEPTRREVTIAYLLFRVADTLEDATRWPRERKLEELAVFDALLIDPDAGRVQSVARSWVEDPPLEHAGYVELLGASPTVIEAWSGLAPAARELIGTHTRRTIAGMSGFVERERSGLLQLSNIEDLRGYCYAVAGIVGEMLTELFLLDRPGLDPIAGELRRDAACFGEALQLVNILKDVSGDADEGRNFLPPDADPSEVFALARHDLELAGRYVTRLFEQQAPRGILEFTLMPVLLAWSTLDRVAEFGPGEKLTRPEVKEILKRMETALDEGDLGGLGLCGAR